MARKAVKRQVKRPADKIIDGLQDAIKAASNNVGWKVIEVSENLTAPTSMCEALEYSISQLEARIAASIGRINSLMK